MVAKIVKLGRTVAEEKRASAAKRVFTVKQRDKRRARRVTVEDIAKIPGRSRAKNVPPVCTVRPDLSLAKTVVQVNIVKPRGKPHARAASLENIVEK